MIVPRGVTVISDGKLDTNSGEFVFESEFTDGQDYNVVLSNAGAGANV